MNTRIVSLVCIAGACGLQQMSLASPGVAPAGSDAQEFAPGIISTPDSNAATFMPDGKTVFISRWSGSGADRRGTLMSSRLKDGAWTAPERVEFSGEFNDFDPSVSPDGSQLFFASIRPETGGRPALWVADKTATGWSRPRSLAAVTGADGVAVFPCATASGNLYFAGHGPGLDSLGDDDIYVCRRLADGSYGKPENLGPAVNSAAQDYDAYVAPDESFLIFASRRPGGITRSDFYISVRKAGVWTPARNLGPTVNFATSTGICCPAVSPDRQWFYFRSGREGRRGTYRIEFQQLLASLEDNK